VCSGKKPSTLKRRNVLRNCRSGFDSDVSSDLRVGRFVTVPLGEARDVIENFFLTLGTWQHNFNPIPADALSMKRSNNP